MPDHRRKDADCPSPVAAAEGTAAGMSSEHHCPGSSPAGNYYSGEPAPDIAVALVNPDFEVLILTRLLRLPLRLVLTVKVF